MMIGYQKTEKGDSKGNETYELGLLQNFKSFVVWRTVDKQTCPRMRDLRNLQSLPLPCRGFNGGNVAFSDYFWGQE